jgi:hypothetical protein
MTYNKIYNTHNNNKRDKNDLSDDISTGPHHVGESS